jgi:hypothetical protein
MCPGNFVAYAWPKHSFGGIKKHSQVQLGNEGKQRFNTPFTTLSHPELVEGSDTFDLCGRLENIPSDSAEKCTLTRGKDVSLILRPAQDDKSLNFAGWFDAEAARSTVSLGACDENLRDELPFGPALLHGHFTSG